MTNANTPTERPVWGDGVKALRAIRHMTQEELADLVGTSQGAISELESGGRRVRDGLRIRIAEALGVDVYELFPYLEESA